MRSYGGVWVCASCSTAPGCCPQPELLDGNYWGWQQGKERDCGCVKGLRCSGGLVHHTGAERCCGTFQTAWQIDIPPPSFWSFQITASTTNLSQIVKFRSISFIIIIFKAFYDSFANSSKCWFYVISDMQFFNEPDLLIFPGTETVFSALQLI